MKIGKFFLLGISFIVFCGIYLYEPIKENHIYTRGIELNEDVSLQESIVSEEAIIMKAKTKLEEILSIKIEDENYNITVDYESLEVSNYVTSYQKQDIINAQVGFGDIDTENCIYMITYNTNSGEVVQLFALNEYIYDNDEYLSEEQLEQLSKKICAKIVEKDEREILYFNGEIIAENYSSTIILNESYQSISIDLNPYNGELIYYYKNY